MWQPKAWYDSKTCNQWVVDYAVDEILKTDLSRGQRHLVLCDNLGGQTKKTNPKFAKLLLDLCGADVWNLLAGCTDEIQVVDAGFGALTKRCTEEVQMEWMHDDENWAEWTGDNLSASRKRVLMTHWYGEGYDRACQAYDFTKVFNSCGSNLTADGSGDSKIKLQGLHDFSFEIADAQRDPLTGETVEDATTRLDNENAAAENAENAAASDESEVEELSDNDGSASEDGGETTDDEDGEPFVDDMYTIAEGPPTDEKEWIGKSLAHRWDEGWYTGEISHKVGYSENVSRNGKYACKYPDTHREQYHDLYLDDYGVSKMWVLVKPK